MLNRIASHRHAGAIAFVGGRLAPAGRLSRRLLARLVVATLCSLLFVSPTTGRATSSSPIMPSSAQAQSPTLSSTGSLQTCTAPAYSDDFEAPSINPFWTQEYGTTGTGSVALSTSVAHSGTQSVAVTTNVYGGNTNLSHYFPCPLYGTVSVWVYYSNVTGTGYKEFVIGNGPVPSIDYPPSNVYLLYIDWGNLQTYLAYPSGSGGSTALLLPQTSTGWHQWTFASTPNGVAVGIDGTTVFTQPVGFAFNSVKLRQCCLAGSAYFDDFSFAQPALNVSLLSGTPFQTITLTGANFGPAEPVQVYWDVTSTPPLTTVTTLADGSFVAHVAVPQAAAGTHTFVAVGQTSAATASASFQVKPAVLLDPSPGKAGSVAYLVGVGFGANEVVAGLWYPGLKLLSAAGSNAVGAVVMSFTVPLSATGTYYVAGYGLTSKAVAVAPFAVSAQAQETEALPAWLSGLTAQARHRKVGTSLLPSGWTAAQVDGVVRPLVTGGAQAGAA